MYLLLDNDKVVRCMASEMCNLHKDKIAAGMRVVEAGYGGIVGDKYDPKSKKWEKHPENYPQPSQKDIYEAKITARIRKIAIDQLKEAGELPPDYQS